MFGGANKSRYGSARDWTGAGMQVIQQYSKRIRVEFDNRELRMRNEGKKINRHNTTRAPSLCEHPFDGRRELDVHSYGGGYVQR